MYKNFTTNGYSSLRHIRKLWLVMQLTTLLLLLSLLQVSASTYGQLITLNKRNTPLEDVLKEIRRQSGYDFLYDLERVKESKSVTISIKDAPLQDALQKCLDGLSMDYSIEDHTVIIREKPKILIKKADELLFASIDVRGRVVDSLGRPLVGASIRVKGKRLSTSTNSNGEFVLNGVEEDAVLVISFLGYEPQERKASRQFGTIALKVRKSDLEEVVVQSGGYYSLDERKMTGNVTTVDRAQFDQQVVHSPMEALQGRVAGLEIETRTGLSGQASLVTLRGQGSIRAFGDIPLYIIDGVPIDNRGLSSLSQTYDGAVGLDPLATLDPSLIESIEILKDADATAIYGSRGANGVIIINTKRGQSGKTKLELHTEMGISKVGKYIKLLDTEQYLEMRREAFENDGVTPTNSNAPDLLLWDQDRYTDWQKELIGGNAKFQKYQASISGGTDQTSFLLSGGFQKEGTVFPGDFGFQNNNVHANINHRSQDNRLQLNTSINYGYRKSNLFNAGVFVNNGISLAPNAPALFDEEGNINWELDEYGNPTFISPVLGLKNPNTNRMQSLQWNGNVSYRLLKGLHAKLNLGMNQLSQRDELIAFKKNITPLMVESFRVTTFTQRSTSRNHLIVEPQLNYNLNLKDHRINSLLGATFQKNESIETSLRGRDYFSDSQVNNVSLAENKELLRHDNVQYRYSALFGRIGYSYADRYHLNLTGRRDGSSRFGKKNRFGNFGAIGAAWEFYKEDYVVDHWKWLSYGKFRGSYGTTGSDHIGDYQFLDTYSQIGLASGSLSGGGLIPSKIYNPYYQWEKNTKLELALELGLWNEKILFTSGWYRERSGNQLIGMFLPSTTGFDNVQGNFPATVENTGWEFVLQTIPVQTSNFTWNSNINLTIPKNRLVDFPGLESSSYASRYVIGESLGIQKLYHYTGINSETGKYTFEDVNGDGVLNNEDKNVIIDMSREYYGGWYNNLSFKNWSLSFLFEFVKQQGHDPIITFGGTAGGRGNIPVDMVLDSWRKSNPSGKYQAYTQSYNVEIYDYRASDAYIVDASFIRMKSLSINHRLPINFLQNLGMQQAHIYLNAQNLFTLTSHKGLDAQWSSAVINLPALTSVHLGIKLTL